MPIDIRWHPIDTNFMLHAPKNGSFIADPLVHSLSGVMLNFYNTNDHIAVFMCSKLIPNLFLKWLQHEMSNKEHDSCFQGLSTPN